MQYLLHTKTNTYWQMCVYNQVWCGFYLKLCDIIVLKFLIKSFMLVEQALPAVLLAFQQKTWKTDCHVKLGGFIHFL